MKGLTLIELLIALLIVIVVLSIGYSLYLTGIKGFIANADSLDGLSNVRIAMEHIKRSFRNSNTIKVDGDYLRVGLNTYRLNGDILMVNINQLATGISEFTISQTLPHQVYIRISSLPNSQGESFTLEAWLTVRRF